MCIVDNPLFSDPSVILAIGESLVNDWVPFKDMDYHHRKHPLNVWDMIPSIPRHQSPKRFDWRMLLLGEEQSWLVVLTILKNITAVYCCLWKGQEAEVGPMTQRLHDHSSLAGTKQLTSLCVAAWRPNCVRTSWSISSILA